MTTGYARLGASGHLKQCDNVRHMRDEGGRFRKIYGRRTKRFGLVPVSQGVKKIK